MFAVLAVAIALLFYIYVGYPALMWMWAARRRRIVASAPTEPLVSVIVVAHNEAARIGGRIENLLAIDYPRERLEIIIASDGSTDETVERARAFQDRSVVVHAFHQRRGKPAVLDEIVPTARGEIVVLADARQRFDAHALRALAAPFVDPRVGAVSGELVLTNDTDATTGSGVGFYWRYEKLIRRSESGVDSTVGATGAIYAIRRSLFQQIPADTVLDDVLIPMNVVRRGFRVLFEADAVAYDRVAVTTREEFTRKVRTIAGNFQLFVRERWLFNPRRNRLWFQTVSHKAARLVTPLLHVVAFVANVPLAADPWLGLLLAVQTVFYASAFGGFLLRNARTRMRLLSVPYAICLLSWATVVAFVRYVSGRQEVTWERASA
jgi:poly-beta-1,6-N-acetyl-D-glucosamine synthase